ncbi:unnamed protein product [Brachionus calyciflorus]|uniref:Uncharacterized protein n=1 Tax=Brachionus calyciflorus TaxID=104777 RepID=A0A813TED1_9BILA|nr:unnamed protein product [Brachionus calyciflorus]
MKKRKLDNIAKQVNKEVTKDSTPRLTFNDCLNQTKINEQQKTIDNIQQNLYLMAKASVDNKSEINKTNDNLTKIVSGFERLMDMITQIKENEKLTFALFNEMKNGSFKVFEYLIKSSPRNTALDFT